MSTSAHRTTLRRTSAVALALTAGLSLSACGTGFGAQTNEVYQAGIGADERGPISVYGAQLVENADGTATLSASLQNETGSTQSISSVTATDLSGQELEVRSPRILVPLPEGEAVQIGTEDSAVYRVKDVGAGYYARVTFTFTDAQDVTIEAPAVARVRDLYDTVAGS